MFYKKEYEIFKVKFQKVPQIRESKQYKFLEAIQTIYLNYLVTYAVQPRTGTEMIQNVQFTLLTSKFDKFEVS